MKGEQTAQRVAKGPGGHYVVGETRKASSVWEFELLYHETGNISSLFSTLTSNDDLTTGECRLPHTLSNTRRATLNGHVEKLLDHIAKRKNPWDLANSPGGSIVPLHNIVTGVAVDPQVASRLLLAQAEATLKYEAFRQERLVECKEKISARIKKFDLPAYNHQPTSSKVHI